MAATIILDAGHGGYDNGASYNGRREKDDTLRAALAVGQKLEDAGYHVLYTRTTDRYDSPFEKAQIANRSGADYFISFHRNSGPNPNTYNGTQALVYEAGTEAARLGKSINDELVDFGFKDLGVVERPGLVVLRRTQMPAVLMELGFINNESDNQLFDQQFNEMVDAIVTGVEKALPLKTPSRKYGVQVGLYRYESNAAYMKDQLESQGYFVSIRWEDPYYAVIVGREDSLDDAMELQNQLRQDGYDTLVVSM
ncbi:MAG: N-acetylmuramoyl-L-alanine amidase [Lachnospiraceae bacterium]|nr:N-acetylmuramoyl-L-alanine amidase [Lachnospiraceae bacterium]